MVTLTDCLFINIFPPTSSSQVLNVRNLHDFVYKVKKFFNTITDFIAAGFLWGAAQTENKVFSCFLVNNILNYFHDFQSKTRSVFYCLRTVLLRSLIGKRGEESLD